MVIFLKSSGCMLHMIINFIDIQNDVIVARNSRTIKVTSHLFASIHLVRSLTIKLVLEGYFYD